MVTVQFCQTLETSQLRDNISLKTKMEPTLKMEAVYSFETLVLTVTSEGIGDMFLWNVATLMADYTVSQP